MMDATFIIPVKIRCKLLAAYMYVNVCTHGSLVRSPAPQVCQMRPYAAAPSLARFKVEQLHVEPSGAPDIKNT